MRSVVWRTGALGDFVCTLPVLHRLRDASDSLVVVAPVRYRALWDGADRWIDAEGAEATRLLAGTDRLEADLGVAWTATGAEALRGARTVLRGSLPGPGHHAVDALWAPLEAMFGPRDRDPMIPPRPGWPGQPRVLAPGSGGARKRWPLERWHALSAALDDVLWVGGPVEAHEPGWGSPRRDDLDLRELVALASACRCWIGPDTGPTHLARAVGARVAAIFVGATDPAVWAPPGARVFEGDPDPADVARWAR